MQEDFHYYATYCAAYLAGYSHEESMDICYCAQLVDLCSKTFLSKIKAPLASATTQLQLEMMDARLDIIGLQDITRIWASFHFLPYDLYAVKKWRPKIYMNRYRLICKPNSDLMVKTVMLAKNKPLQAVGLAMHVLADTWAHSYFAGTPSLVINNTTWDFREVIEVNGEEKEVPIKFRHNPSAKDDLENNIYTNSLFQNKEHSVMNLGHGRAGHLPDYSFMKYRYIPAWDDYREITKDNPSDYMKAFTQMIYAMKYLRGEIDTFEKDKYDMEAIQEHKERIEQILRKRQLIASDDWKSFGEELSGNKIDDFDINKYQQEYMSRFRKAGTFLGKFISAAIAQKSMVTNEIYRSKNYLAGFSKEVSLKKNVFDNLLE